jgi:hypothetical protein
VKELENENNSLKFALSMNKLALKRLTADFAALEKAYKMAKATNAMSSGGRYSSTETEQPGPCPCAGRKLKMPAPTHARTRACVCN